MAWRIRPGLVATLLAVLSPACSPDGVPGGSGDPGDLGEAPGDLATGPDLGDRLPWDSDLSLTVRGLDGDEGLTAWLRVHYTVTDVKTPWRPVAVRRGMVSDLVRGGFDSNTFGEFVQLYVDRLGDGACTEGTDPAWQLFINNSFPRDKVVQADIDLMSTRPGDFQVRKCSEL